MSEAGPRLTNLKIWAKREERCLAIIERALRLLRSEEDLPESECDLNRRFFFQLLQSSRDLYPSDPIGPVAECNNQPDIDDDARAVREHKRPDFQWVYLDKYEPDPKRAQRQFILECKRLGRPQRSDWILNVNYVRNGVARFRDPAWGYGRRFQSAAMVGFWQSMDLDEVVKEVNEEAARSALPHILPTGNLMPDGHRSEHTFDRPFPVSPFRLLHLWIDLRPQTCSTP